MACNKGSITLKGQARGIQSTQQDRRLDAGELGGAQGLAGRNIQDVAYAGHHSSITAVEERAGDGWGQHTDKVLEAPYAEDLKDAQGRVRGLGSQGRDDGQKAVVELLNVGQVVVDEGTIVGRVDGAAKAPLVAWGRRQARSRGAGWQGGGGRGWDMEGLGPLTHRAQGTSF